MGFILTPNLTITLYSQPFSSETNPTPISRSETPISFPPPHITLSFPRGEAPYISPL